MPNKEPKLIEYELGLTTKWIVLSLFLVLCGLIGYILGVANISQDDMAKTLPPTTATTATSASTAPAATTAPATTTVTPKETDKPSTTVSVDDTWNKYTSFKKGFSIKIPKKTLLSSCEKDSSTGYYSTTSTTNVPTKVFEDDQAVYPGYQYTYQLGGEVKKDGQSYFTTCGKVDSKLADFQNKTGIENGLRVKDIKSDTEFDAFLKANYGSGCSMGDKTESAQTGTFDVRIKGDGEDLEKTTCPVNYRVMLKYSPDKKKLAFWSMGQDFNFPKSGGEGYDDDMLASFKFE